MLLKLLKLMTMATAVAARAVNWTMPSPASLVSPVPTLRSILANASSQAGQQPRAAAAAASAAAAAASASSCSSRTSNHLFVGKPLATLAHHVKVTYRPGTGPGRHAFDATYSDGPFPIRQGGVVATFDALFAKGFEWGCRGKVGGFSIGPGASNGGDHSPNGASHRLMWDAGGGAYAYVYVPSGTERRQPEPLRQHGQFGVGVFAEHFRGALRAGAWHHVALGLKLNTFAGSKPNADGVLLLSIDGTAHLLRNVVWRQYPNLAVEDFALATFHGGPCEATRVSHSEFKNLEVFAWH